MELSSDWGWRKKFPLKSAFLSMTFPFRLVPYTLIPLSTCFPFSELYAVRRLISSFRFNLWKEILFTPWCDFHDKGRFKNFCQHFQRRKSLVYVLKTIFINFFVWQSMKLFIFNTTNLDEFWWVSSFKVVLKGLENFSY